MAKNNKVEEVGTITNTYFAGLPDKAKVRISGIIKSIKDKETASGTAKQFKGDIAVEGDAITYRGKNLFCPGVFRDQILTALNKIGKWSVFEFVLSANKIVNEAGSSWVITWEIAPRAEKPRVLALLDV